MTKTGNFDREKLLEALKLLSERLRLNKGGHYALLVCGGSALIALNYKDRVTKDVDIVALIQESMLELNPASDEILAASKWCMTHDVSEGFRQILISFLGKFGYDTVISKL